MFLERHAPAAPPAAGEAGAREERARAVIRDGLAALRDAARALPDPEPDTGPAGLADLVRQWLEAQPGPAPSAPRPAGPSIWSTCRRRPTAASTTSTSPVSSTANGLRPPLRNVFYPAAMLAGFGWPRERARLRAARAGFRDLIGLARSRVALSAFAHRGRRGRYPPSAWLDDVSHAGLARVGPEERAAGKADAVPCGPSASAVSASAAPIAAVAIAAPAGAAAEWLAWRRPRAARRGDGAAGGASGEGAPDGRGGRPLVARTR